MFYASILVNYMYQDGEHKEKMCWFQIVEETGLFYTVKSTLYLPAK